MRRLLSLVGVILFVAIIVSAGPGQILESFRGARALPFVTAMLCSAAMLVLKSWRWSLLLRHADLSNPLSTVMRYFLVGNFLGLATPARVGDFAKALYLAGRGGNSFARAGATIFVDRLLDVSVLAILGMSVLLQSRGRLIMLPLVLIALLVPLLAAKRRLGERLLRRVFRKIAPGAHRDRVGDEFDAFYRQVSSLLTRGRLILPFALTVFSYALIILGVSRIAEGLRVELPLDFVASSVVLAIFVALLPISVGGLGSREAVLIACFAQRGLPAESAVSLSIVFFALFYLAPATVGAILWQRRPVPLPQLG